MMIKYIVEELLFIILLLLLLVVLSIEDQSISIISDYGKEFVPIDNSLPPLAIFQSKDLLYCYSECNKHVDCRIFDFDDNSKICRLWDVDLTAGSIRISSLKPRSLVGTIKLSPNIYINIHNKPCDLCLHSRYEICDINSNTCQCPLKTYWNGLICTSQLLYNQTCSQIDACRSDLNLTCQPTCDLTYRCLTLPSIGVGQTVAGFCNGSLGNGLNDVGGPWGIYISPLDGVLYVADCDRQIFQSFSPYSRTGSIIFSTGVIQPIDVFVDNSNTIYMVDGGDATNAFVYIQRNGILLRSFPDAGLSTSSCLFNGITSAYGISVDMIGNIYLSLYQCSIVVKWSPNATNGTLVVGKRLNSGSSNTQFNNVRFIHLDEDRNALYVTDVYNNRIQKFILSENGTGITVAGNLASGTALNRLNQPAGVRVTRDGRTMYIADYGNNRIMKYQIGENNGTLIAGNVNGASGSTSQLLNKPAGLVLDPTETYLYVADYGNHRIQRFRIK